MTEDESILLAGEYVLGTLDERDHHRAERLLASDSTFQEHVERWRERFSEFDNTTPPLSVGDELWNRIQASIASSQVPPPVIVPNPVSAFQSLWRSLPFWRAAGLAGAFASLALAVGIGLLATRPARQPVLVAVLLSDTNQPAAVVNAFASGGAEIVPLGTMTIPQDRAFEVWTFPDPNAAPVSIGLLKVERTIPLNLDRIPGLRPDQLFAISVEPPQGSPTGSPTGPVILKGTASTAL